MQIVLLTLLSACVPYVPPAPVSPEAFSRDLPASYDRTWSAVTYVAGASFYKIKAFEKASGLMTLDFELKNPARYVDCGGSTNRAANPTLPTIFAIVFTGISLEGTANVNIRSEGPGRTAIQFNSQYTLAGYRPDGAGGLQNVATWQFTSGSSDTQNVLGTLVTCRPSYLIERDFLNEVAARL